MALKLTEKELVAVGTSVAAGCKPCTNYHLREVRKTEASDAEIRQAIAQAAQVRRDATEIMEGHGLEQLRASCPQRARQRPKRPARAPEQRP